MMPLSILLIVNAQHTARHDEDEKDEVGITDPSGKPPANRLDDDEKATVVIADSGNLNAERAASLPLNGSKSGSLARLFPPTDWMMMKKLMSVLPTPGAKDRATVTTLCGSYAANLWDSKRSTSTTVAFCVEF